MTTIGLISDTHSYLDDAIFDYFKDVDEIWHLGDIGDPEVLSKLQMLKPVRAVYGNIDDQNLRSELPEHSVFSMEGLNVYLTHIGALPPNYTKSIKKVLIEKNINLFLCGHSHILRVIKDQKISGLVYINPGAAGKHGFHKVRTVMKMVLENGKVKHMEVKELGLR